MAEIDNLISDLSNSDLYGTCPNCRKSSKLSEFVMFSSTGEFPEEGKKSKDAYEELFENGTKDFQTQITRATEGAEKTSKAVGFGKTIEKMIHLHKKFNIPLEDCRFLAEPLDVIVFNGAAANNVDHITFMEIKSGNARLNKHQNMIKKAIKKNNVKVETI